MEINNHQAGFIATEHLIQLGCEKIGFLGYHGEVSTISGRMAGYESALALHGLRPAMAVEIEDASRAPMLSEVGAAEAFVCVNDRVAAQLMQVYLAANIRIPDNIRLVGIDDVVFAKLLPVPLTTVRQPTKDIGRAALRAMLERIQMPGLPPREILLDGELVVRRSCGSLT